jgi:LPXTG-site transpeptidase (sortase) family protein
MRRLFNSVLIISILLGVIGLTPASVVKAQTPTADISVSVEFSPETIAQQGVARLTLTLANANIQNLTDTAFNLDLPTGLLLDDPVSLNNTCGGTAVATAGQISFSLSGGTIPGGGTCTFAINVGATVSGNREFTIASGAISGYLDGVHSSNLASASDTLNVANFDFNAEINKQFNPLVINPGDKSNMRVSIYNSNTFQLEDASWVDNLPSGLFIANPPNVTTTNCGSSIIVADNLTSSTLTPGGNSLTIRDATVPAQVGSINGECRVSVDVTSNRSGENLINTIAGGVLSATGNGGTNTISNTDDASATLTVRTLDTPSISKGFAPSTIWVGEPSRLTINIHNDDTVLGIDTVSLTDNLPTNVVLAPTVSPTLTNCGSSANLTAASGTGIITIEDAEIVPEGTCVIQVNVTSTVQGEYTNTIPIGAISSRQGVTNDAIAEDQLNVQAVSILKSISPSSILAGDEATLTITLRNPSSIPYTNTTLADILPNTLAGSNVYYTGTPSTTCAGGLLTISTTHYADDTLTLTGATVPSGTYSAMGTCTISATLTTADTALTRTHTNTLGIGVLDNDQHVTNLMSASANLAVSAQTITVVKSFSPSSVQEGGLTTVSIQFRNPTSAILHINSFIDELPSGLVPEGTASTTCANGEASTSGPVSGLYSLVLSAAADPGTGAEIPAGTVTVPGTCTVSVPVRIATAGTYTNTVPVNAIDTEEDITNLNPDSEAIVVYPTGLGMTGSKTFSDDFVLAGNSTRLRITLNAPADTAISNLSVTDNLPTNMVISNIPPASTTCGGTLTATTGASSISLSGGSITQGGSCRIDVYVTSTVSGTYTNTVYSSSDPLINNITNDENRRPAANLSDTVTFSHLEMAKAFYPDIVAPNGRTTVTITLTNRNEAAITDLSLTDNMADIGSGSFFTIASTPNARTTCPLGIATATAGSQLLSLSGATIPAQVSGTPGICTVSVDVVASGTFSPTPWTRNNTVYRSNVLGTLAGAPIRPVADAQAAITVRPLTIGVVKGFDPLTVFGGSSSTMTITLINENTTVLTGIAFTDTMPTGMYLSNPVNANVGTCGGNIVATPGAQTFSFEGGVLPANKQCSLTLNATMNVHGNRTNTIPVGAVTTFNGAANTQAAQASLTNLPGASVTKFFSPSEIVLGEAVLLTIQLKNTGNIALSNVGFTDTLPPGITIAASPAPTNACNGILTATPGSNLIQLGAGSIAAGPNTTCNIVVPVEASGAGIYTNTIGVGNVTSSEGATNTERAEDTLTVKASPSLQLVKSFIPGSAPYDPDETLNYSLVATNTGDINLTNVTITDSTVGMVMGTCTPVSGSTLAPGASMTCPASHVVTAADVTAGTYVNTASADSDQTEAVFDDVTVSINAGPALGINKVISTAGPYELGDTLTYQITATNIGTEVLNNVSISDPKVTLGTCTPNQPATLAVNESMVCPASYVVTQADVDAETFTNTATATGTPPIGPAITDTDSVTIPIVDNARLDIYKQVISTGPYNFVGAVVTYDISAVNNGDQTLTNVTITDPGTGVTLGTCTPAQPATLATGEILSCTATHTITSDDLAAGGFTNTAYADSDQTDPVSDTAEVVTLVPTIQLEKTGTRADTDGSGDASAGDVVTYVFTVTNTGQVTLNNIRVTDLVGGVTVSGGPPFSLAPGASDNTTYTGNYTLTQADVNAGTFTNTASVVGTPDVGSIVSDLDDDTQTLTPNPSITVVKTGIRNLDASAPSGIANPGDTIAYTFRVENTGNVTLTNVTVTDPDATISGGPIASMEPGDVDTTTFTGTYTVDQTDVDHGSFTNTATVSGTPPSGPVTTDTDDDTQTLPPVPGITLVKSGVQNMGTNSRIDAGETISYSFTITNTGNVTLTNVLISDPNTTISGGPITLQPGQSDSTSITGTHTVTQTEINSGSFTNTATVTGTTPAGPTVSDTDDDSQTFIQESSITLNKTGTVNLAVISPDTRADAGDTVSYAFTITNTGNVTLTNVLVTDTVGGVTINGGPLTLQPGDSNSSSITGTYTLTQADIDSGQFSNTARVSGTPPSGPVASAEDDDTRSFTDDSSISLSKTGIIDASLVLPDGQVDPGDQINYTFTITNTGNVTLSNIQLTDTIGGVTISGGPITSLAPNASDSTTFSGRYTVNEADVDLGTFTNTATTSGTPPSGPNVSDSDDDTRNLGNNPIIGLAKRVVGSPAEASPGIWHVTFEILVRNYGNVTLSGIQVTDDIEAVFGSDPFTIVSVTSSDFAVNPAFDGLTAGDTNLLAGTDSLVFEEDGIITLVVQVTPSSGGPFTNTALGSGTPPTGDDVTDDSHDGVNPDEDGDNDPTNDNDPTPVDFGANLFDPPFGMKVYDASGLPLMRWTMVWINDTNIVAIDAAVSDPIPAGTVYQATGLPSGTGVAPASAGIPDSTDVGVSCTSDPATAIPTVTDYCYYEGPTLTYPRGRIVWMGSLGPDLGVTDPALAVNDLSIVFNVLVNTGVREVYNRATVDADLNGDGIFDGIEIEVDDAEETWSNWPSNLPVTGFAPGVKTDLGERPMVSYANSDMVLEIPSLKVNAPIVGVPIQHGSWNLDWLGNKVGYLEGTAFPTWNGNSGLTAHNTNVNGQPGVFANLENLRYGQQVIVHGWGQRYIYEVRSVKTMVEPENSDVITHEKLPWLTLITCRGYDEETDSYRWRVVVRAVLVKTEAE